MGDARPRVTQQEIVKHSSAVGQKAHMQSASRCPRCSKEVRETLVTCGACGQSAKAGEKLHCFDHCPDFMKGYARSKSMGTVQFA